MKHWVFDFDGTLVDTDGSFGKTLGYALAPFNIKVDEDFIEKIRHKHPNHLFEDYLNPDECKKVYARLTEASHAVSEEIQLFPGVMNVLEQILESDCSLSIWTGRDRWSTELILKKQGIEKLFDKIISGSCVKNNKPGHDGLLEIQRHHQADVDEMIMIGDHHHDIEPANSLGIVSVHARWKTKPVILPKKIQPNYKFGCTTDFHNWVKDRLKA